MKLHLERGSEFDPQWMLHIGDNAFAHLENDWPQIWGKYNWKTYRLAHIYYEDDVWLGGKELVFVLFGIGFRFRYNDPNNEKMKELDETVQSIKNGKS